MELVRLKKFLLSNYNMKGEDLLIKLVKEGERYSGDSDQKDDIALMLLEIL